ncbi:(d)CMP kinase, partial [Patescibacteria group bacterium]|nr:(d)CMP kinase [Patescibacteria group bacterium]
PIKLPDIQNITVSGRIASGASTLAIHLSQVLGWEFLNGGEIFRQFTTEKKLDIILTNTRPDKFDLEYEEKIKKLLKEKSYQIIQSHLAGFNAQGIEGIFKILVVCEDDLGEDKRDIRIDRLVNRDGKKVEDAKLEIVERERQNLEKWRRLYAGNDKDWVYWDKKYYDLVVNTYSLNAQESTQTVLDAIGYKSLIKK